MATITTHDDKSLSLNLDADERAAFDELHGQLEAYITIWLKERFRNVWQDRLKRLTIAQKQDLLTFLAEEVKPVEEEKPAEPVQ